MTTQEVQFQHGESEETRVRKLRVLVEELIRLSRKIDGDRGITKLEADSLYSPIDHPGHLPP